jgi:dsRNA-specific ribonuclease
MRGRAAAAKKSFESLIAAAWHVEAFARAKKLPKLKTLFDRPADGPRYKSTADMKAGLDALAAQGAAHTTEDI